jgi:hypothetical protein
MLCQRQGRMGIPLTANRPFRAEALERLNRDLLTNIRAELIGTYVTGDRVAGSSTLFCQCSEVQSRN